MTSRFGLESALLVLVLGVGCTGPAGKDQQGDTQRPDTADSAVFVDTAVPSDWDCGHETPASARAVGWDSRFITTDHYDDAVAALHGSQAELDEWLAAEVPEIRFDPPPAVDWSTEKTVVLAQYFYKKGPVRVGLVQIWPFEDKEVRSIWCWNSAEWGGSSVGAALYAIPRSWPDALEVEFVWVDDT